MQVAASIFKAYDIRGIVGQTLTRRWPNTWAEPFGTEALKLGEKAVAVGRDGRVSGPSLSAALIAGLRSTGINVIDLGAVTTPMLYYVAATRGEQGCHSGIQVTGSHNPKDYNGFKMVLAVAPFTVTTSRACASASRPRTTAGRWRLSELNVLAEYTAAHRR
jgi:phosphomannomutase